MTHRPIKPRLAGTTKGLVTAFYASLDGDVPEAARHLDRSLSQTYGYGDEAVGSAHMTLEQARRLAAAAPHVTLFAEEFAAICGGWYMPTGASQQSAGELIGHGHATLANLIAQLLRMAAPIGRDPKLAAELMSAITALAQAVAKVRH